MEKSMGMKWKLGFIGDCIGLYWGYNIGIICVPSKPHRLADSE